jgi:hypothetical protein
MLLVRDGPSLVNELGVLMHQSSTVNPGSIEAIRPLYTMQ